MEKNNNENKVRYSVLLKNMTREWKWILSYMKKYLVQILFYVFVGIIATVTSLGTSVASKYLIDTVVNKNSGELIKYVSLTVSLAVFSIVFNAISSWISAKVSTKTNNEIKQEIFSNMLLAEWEDINCYQTGDLLNRIEGDVSTVSSGVITFIPNLLTRFLNFFGALVIVLIYDKTMALLALLSVPFFFFASRILIRAIRKYNKQMREVNGQVLSFSSESFQNIQVVKAFNLTGKYISDFIELIKYYRQVRLNYEKFSIIVTLVLSFLGLIVSYACYGWGVYRLWQGAITFGTMTLFLQIASTLSNSFSSLAGMVPTAVTIATSAGRIMEISNFQKESDDDKETAEKFKDSARSDYISLEADNVSFKYKSSEQLVLNNVSFSFEAGNTVAIIGASGEGKTTLLKLILGLLNPTQGKLEIKNSDGSLKISDSTRRFCAYVPQEKSIFSGTVAENLRMVKPDATDEELIEVLKQSELWEFIEGLPSGLNSVVGKDGVDFSQGQNQRIAVARALLSDAEIVLLDEATSALDSDTESRMLENIMKNKPYRICIITTHKDNLLKYCDYVYKIDENGNLINIVR